MSPDSSDLDARSPGTATIAPTPGIPSPSRVTVVAWLIVFLLLALLVRLPVLYNATYLFNSDEAVDALVMRHLLSGREITLFNWDSTYYGIAEGLLALPFVLFLGQTAAAFKLGAVAGHWLLILAVYLLAARLYGRLAGLIAAATLVAFSASLLYWSTLASGGYSLVVAIGTLTLWLLDRAQEEPSPRRVLALGLACGLGFYVYQLFLVYLVALALWMVPWSAPWQVALAGSRTTAAQALGVLRHNLRLLAIAGAGFLLGAAPVVARFITGKAGGGKEPSYMLASVATIKAHAVLLVQYAAPVLLGARSPAGRPPSMARALSVLFAAIVVAAWCVAAARALPDVRAALRPRPRGFGTETLLVLLVPLTALLFVLSPNVQDVMSNRYLLPWLSALPVLTGGWLARWWSRGRAGIAAVLVVVIAPLISGLLIHRSSGALDSRWRPQAHEEPLVAVIADLEQRGIRAAYAPYWTAYKATFLAQERVVVTPLASWDRYPPYTAEVDASAHEAYILPVDPPNVSPNGRTLGDAERQRFEAKLAAANRDYDRRDFAFYRVYSARDRSRLLPPPGRQSVIALASPRATLRVLDPPSSLPGQGPSTLAVEVTNTSDAPWSADGISKLAGSLRVTAAYRWLTEDASRSVIVEGERTPLPRDVPVGDTLRLAVRILPPPSPGRYVLRVTLVQENVAWFDQATGSQVALQIDVR